MDRGEEGIVGIGGPRSPQLTKLGSSVCLSSRYSKGLRKGQSHPLGGWRGTFEFGLMDSPSVFSREDGTRVGELFCKSCPDMALIGRPIDWNEVCWDVKLVGCSDSARFVGVKARSII